MDVLGGKFNMTGISLLPSAWGNLPISRRSPPIAGTWHSTTQVLRRDFEEKYGAQLPPPDFENSNWHLFQLVLPERRDGLPARATFMEQMQALGVGITSLHPPIHLLSLYRALWASRKACSRWRSVLGV